VFRIGSHVGYGANVNAAGAVPHGPMKNLHATYDFPVFEKHRTLIVRVRRVTHLVPLKVLALPTKAATQ
jgi:hypothetical protein